jgi:hypothetical protein
MMKDRRGDRVEYINLARQRIADLERILLADLEDDGLSRDEGWDVESLREDMRRADHTTTGQPGMPAPGSGQAT